MESATIDSPTCVDCLFCNGDFIMTSEIYRDEDMVVIDDIKPSGRSHWLIMPLQHIRSVEGLAATHLPLYRRMLAVRDQLLQKHHPDLTPATRDRVRSGFHRGSRRIHVLGPLRITLPEYPLWNSFIFVPADAVLRRLESEEKNANNGIVGGIEQHTELSSHGPLGASELSQKG